MCWNALLDDGIHCIENAIPLIEMQSFGHQMNEMQSFGHQMNEYYSLDLKFTHVNADNI